MNSILWASILASAGVALFTTLLVEYFAKPWLEVRKDRILENKRQQRAAFNDLKQVLFILPRLAIYIEGFNKGTISEEHAKKALAEFAEFTGRLYEVIDLPDKLDDEWVETMSIMHRFSVAMPVANSLPTEIKERFSLAFHRANLFHHYFRTAKWHLWRRHKLVRRIKSVTLPSEPIQAASEQIDSFP